MSSRTRFPVISGVGQSSIGRRQTRSGYQLTLDAILAAVEDAGLTVADIDGLATYPGPVVPITAGFVGPDLYEVQDGLGLNLNWHLSVAQGPAQFMSLMPTALAVAMGLCKHAVVFRTTTESSAQGTGQRRGHDELLTEADGTLAWLLAAGSVSAANWASFFINRHMTDYGTTKEQFGSIVVTERGNAAHNPTAVMREPLTLDQYLASRIISTPLSLFDCDMAVDGSIAVVLSSRETTPDLRHWVNIEAMGSAQRNRPYWEHWHDLHTMAGHDAADHMWSQTDLRPKDVDFAQVYDAFSPFVIFWLEGLGFCKPGEGGPFVEGGERISLHGELPLNTFGGQLSGGRMHGWGFLAEAVRQLRGECGARQVNNAEVGAVGVGGGASASSLLLTKGS